ncbi:MAG: DNA topoisomerase IB [Acidimicrobiales bacterium]
MRLRRVEVDGQGYRRRRAGTGFTYLDCDGARIADADVVARIKALAIPPAWTDVWICPDARGHIQATGLDDRGRRQYRYHDDWRVERDRAKHDRMLELARALPRLRRRLGRDLAAEGVGRERVLACAVRLLELGLFRVGGEAYADDNGSYGLATLRKGHVRAQGDELRFEYPGKGGQRRVVTIGDPRVADVVRALKRRRRGGPELLAYKDERGRWVDVRSSDINEYLQDALGQGFTAKDFRTWIATVLAAVGLAVEQDVASDRQRRSAARRVVRSVARQLGNTPAVARGSYVDPLVIERFEDGRTVGDTLADARIDAVAEGLLGVDGEAGAPDDPDDGPVAVDSVPAALLAEVDAAVADLIEGSPRRPARRRRATS